MTPGLSNWSFPASLVPPRLCSVSPRASQPVHVALSSLPGYRKSSQRLKPLGASRAVQMVLSCLPGASQAALRVSWGLSTLPFPPYRAIETDPLVHSALRASQRQSLLVPPGLFQNLPFALPHGCPPGLSRSLVSSCLPGCLHNPGVFGGAPENKT